MAVQPATPLFKRIYRPGKGQEKSGSLHRSGKNAQGSLGPCSFVRTAGPGIIANEAGVGFRITSGPAIERAGDLAALLTNLQERDVLFIDEIHRLSHSVEEVLYAAMEDYALDIVIGKGPSARSVRIDLPPFTLIGATTQVG